MVAGITNELYKIIVFHMELAKALYVPYGSSYGIGPSIHYEDPNIIDEPLTALYFATNDLRKGRITFEGLDSLKVSRGEYFPFDKDTTINSKGVDGNYPWVWIIQNSNWLIERYQYEKKHYGNSYEFSGNVDEMLTDYNHYLFEFEEQFVEVIAKGFWCEKDEEDFVEKPLQEGHPFLDLQYTNVEKFHSHNLTCSVIKNTTSETELIFNAQYCSQKLMQFTLGFSVPPSFDISLVLRNRRGQLVSILKRRFSSDMVEFEGLATLEQVQPYIEEYMKEVSVRRESMGL